MSENHDSTNLKDFLPLRTSGEAVTELLESIEAAVTGAARDLIQERHLYQSVEVPLDGILRKIKSRIPQGSGTPWMPMYEQYSAGAKQWPWYALDATQSDLIARSQRPGTLERAIAWKPLHVKIFCIPCGRIEAFNLQNCMNLFGRDHESFTGGAVLERGKVVQAFAMAYVCQSCKGAPETFLVRRFGEKLQLCGRAPMEHVDVSQVVPKEVRKYISGAVIARNAGQILPAIFMLRTTCEQWARLATKAASTDRADATIEAYMASLPNSFKETFPSWADLYSRLSAAVHAASEEDAIYAKAFADMMTHFDARRLFKLAPQ